MLLFLPALALADEEIAVVAVAGWSSGPYHEAVRTRHCFASRDEKNAIFVENSVCVVVLVSSSAALWQHLVALQLQHSFRVPPPWSFFVSKDAGSAIS